MQLHCCPPCHSGNLAQGSPTVFTNGLQQGRVGDPVNCGSNMATGSQNVCTGGGCNPVAGTISTVYEHTNGLVYIFTASDVSQMENDGPESVPARNAGDDALQTPPPQPVDPIEEDNTPAVPGEPIETDCGIIQVPAPDSLQLSPNFTLGDVSSLTHFGRQRGSQSGPVRAQLGLSYEDIVCNLKALCENCLEPLAELFGRQNMLLTSGFRRGSSGTSQHLLGMACDVQYPGIPASEYYPRAQAVVRSGIPFDQFILEYGNNNPWHHISFNRGRASQRGSILTYKKRPGKDYTGGLTRFA